MVGAAMINELSSLLMEFMFSMNKQINPRNVDYYYRKVGEHGFHTLKNLQYKVVSMNDKSKMINVTSFTSESDAKDQIFQNGRPKPDV